MEQGRRVPIVFRVAAGSRVGFGHLVRCRSLARTMGVASTVSVRGSVRTQAIAASMGWAVVDATDDAGIRTLDPALIVVDDPSRAHAAAWVRRARRLGVPVASIHDLGIGHVESDLVIDGSIATSRSTEAAGLGRTKPPALSGPPYAILDPAVLDARRRGRRPVPHRVLIALGGGAHVYAVAARLSNAIAAKIPDAEIHVARGFSVPRRPASLERASWVSAPGGLAAELSEATVAVVGGGVTLYEACAIGVPVVAMAVTPAQHFTVRGMVCRGAAMDGGRPPIDAQVIQRAAEAAATLMRHDEARRRQSHAATQAVDGRGAFRVADRLRRLMDAGRHLRAGEHAA